jgi:hypothetical protein
MTMKNTFKNRNSFAALYSLLLTSLLSCAFTAQAQAPSRFVGSVTAISGTTLTVKTDAGDQKQVEVPADAAIKRVAPGEKDLSKAATITFNELAVGDRVLVRLDPNATGATPTAAQIIAVKQEDLAQKQQKDREDWQRRGIGGLVKSVDAASGTLVVTAGAGATAKTVAVHTTKSTILKRYASGSVRFDEAKTEPIDAIKAGDQLRARGEKNADGSEITAEEVVSGTFRNISGTISSLDASASSLVVKDLATKKPVTILISSESQMRRLPERMAQMLATRLKGGSAAPGGATPSGLGAGPANGAPPAGGPPQQRTYNGGSPGGSGPGGPGGGPSGGSGGDPQNMLSRAPAIQLAELQKGEAVMLVATETPNGIAAVTLLAGVEPLLEAPAASQNLLSNWSMGSGGAAEGAGTP